MWSDCSFLAFANIIYNCGESKLFFFCMKIYSSVPSVCLFSSSISYFNFLFPVFRFFFFSIRSSYIFNNMKVVRRNVNLFWHCSTCIHRFFPSALSSRTDKHKNKQISKRLYPSSSSSLCNGVYNNFFIYLKKSDHQNTHG